jgi:hypothetical protein
LCLYRVIAKSFDDRRKESTEAKGADVDANLVERCEPGLGISQCFPHFFDIEIFGFGIAGRLLEAQAHEHSLFFVEEVSCFEIIGEQEEGGDSDDASHETLDDEQPSPSFQAAHTI